MQKTAYEMRISDWSSDVCSADLDHSIAIQRGLGIPIEKLTAGAMARRWPQVDFGGIAVGVMQPTMGALMARRSVQTLVGEFVAAGGDRKSTRLNSSH